MKVSELAQAGGVTAETVRYYTRKGLLFPQRDPTNGYQLYDERDASRLCFIQCFRLLGFNLSEIKVILDESLQEHAPCPRAYALLADRQPSMRACIQELQALAVRLDQATESWQDMPGKMPSGYQVSRLIEDLSQPAII